MDASVLEIEETQTEKARSLNDTVFQDPTNGIELDIKQLFKS